MSENKALRGEDLLRVLNSSRNPFKLVSARNKAILYIKNNAHKLPANKSQACNDYIKNFNSLKQMSDQLRDLAVWVDEMNAYLDYENDSDI